MNSVEANIATGAVENRFIPERLLAVYAYALNYLSAAKTHKSATQNQYYPKKTKCHILQVELKQIGNMTSSPSGVEAQNPKSSIQGNQ